MRRKKEEPRPEPPEHDFECGNVLWDKLNDRRVLVTGICDDRWYIIGAAQVMSYEYHADRHPQWTQETSENYVETRFNVEDLMRIDWCETA